MSLRSPRTEAVQGDRPHAGVDSEAVGHAACRSIESVGFRPNLQHPLKP